MEEVAPSHANGPPGGSPLPGESSPLVSVVIPTFNRARLCARAIRSALAQDYPHLEIIVVDDGSTDGTAELLETEFGGSVIVIRQANAGVSAARNRGVAASTGEFVALLDSDDVWDRTKTAAQVQWLLERPDFGMVLCDVAAVHVDGTPGPIYERRARLPRDGAIIDDVVRAPSLVPSSTLIRRRVYQAVGGFDESLETAEDLDLHLRIAAREKIGVVSLPLVTCSYGDDLGLSAMACTTRDHVAVVLRFVDRQAGLLTPEVARHARFEVLRYNSWSASSSGRPLEGATYGLWALRYARGWREFMQILGLTPLHLKVGLKNLTGFRHWAPRVRAWLRRT